jgi:RNA polymerase sigma factor (sigma-70 family)
MPTQINEVVEYLRSTTLRQQEAGLTDGQLLARFIERRDGDAVAALVRRHGAMVWGVCRRILQNHHDAEDAFQATFIVLVRKAGSVRHREMVGNWLYGVAHQTAMKAKATAAKRRTRERQVTAMPDAQAPEQDAWRDLQPVLDQELSRLPDKYRVAIVWCDLEGKTRKQAARQLGLPEGTLAGRLTRGRAMLARRLARHGLAVPGAALIGVLSGQAAAHVPSSVALSTITTVTRVAAAQGATSAVISANVAALSEGVLQSMLLNKLKSGLAVLAVIAFIAALAGLALGSLGVSGRRTPHETKTAAATDKVPTDKGAQRIRDKILVLDNQFWEAASKHDLETLSKLVADDFVSLTPDGTRWTKAMLLEQHKRVRTGDLKIIGEREVFPVHPKAALLTYEFTYRIYTRSGQLWDTAHQRATSCWVKRDVGWVVAFSQVTTVPGPAPEGQAQDQDKAAVPKKKKPADTKPTPKELLEKGPFQLRALEPSERPRLVDLTEPKRFAALQAAKEVSIFAARDERESFGVVAMGLKGHALTAKATELQGPKGGRIPVSEIRVRWAEGVAVNGVTVPDPLLEEQPFQSPRGIAPMLWVTVHVPRENAPAGVYRGTLTAELKGRTASLPVTLEVFDFALPRTTYLQSSFWLFRHTIRNFYGMKSVPFDFYRRFLDRCLEARLSPVDAAAYHDQPFVQIVRDKNGEYQVDWTEWDRYLGYCMERGMSAFNVGDEHWFGSYFASFQIRDLKTGKAETVTLSGKKYEETVVRFFRLAREHFTHKGWARRAYLQGYDEPEADNAKLLAGIKRFYELARQGWPGLRTLITAPPQRYAALHPSIGIWCPLTAEYWDAEAVKCRKRGEEVWWYVCKNTTAPWANFFLDQSGATHRVLFWQTFGRRSDGLLYWGVNFWPGFEARSMKPPPAEKMWPKVPWNDAGGNGDGYFLYPGPRGPLTSLRFEIMRDGVEDYDALRMLEELVKRKGDRFPAQLRERARQALTLSPEVFASMTKYPADAGAMVKRRRLVNELIVLLLKSKGER